MPTSKFNEKSNGLTSKEKMYVITSCQTRSTRYKSLKALAANAIKCNKIFAVYDNNNAVRKALVERGWVEKIPLTRMNLFKIRHGIDLNKSEIHSELEKLLLSHFVEKYSPNFIWRTTEEQRNSAIDMQQDLAIVNKLRIDATWTTKQGLCSSMKRNYWFYIEDVAEANAPRTYNSYDAGEVEGFITDFKITACTSLLKWVLSMVANDRPVFVPTGKISMNVVVFALNRCKEYLFRKQNKDIDCELSSVSCGQWNSFLKKYYRIIATTEVFQADENKKLPLYLGYAKFLLTEIHRYRPQLSCEGCHNIWIIKPAHCCRGRGIRMASKLGVITNILNKANSKFVVQKYIEEPLLIHETKFDIRQYYLITSTCPLVIWMYQDCYLKFSSQRYNLRDYHESIHLTNNAVQRKYKNCDNRHDELPTYNMWDSEKYKSYLTRIGKDDVWDTVIYPGMKKSIIATMLSCQDSLVACKNRFELYGCDFILDKNYNPWLIEINSCPDLQHTTPVTGKICPAVITDIIKVVIDYRNDSSSSTGKFECIYRQPLTVPRFTMSTDLSLRGYTLPQDYFYKGKIEIQESYDDPDIGKERDIRGIMRKIKKIYDDDIMLEPERDCYSDTNDRSGKKVPLTESENELSEVATCITEQLDEIFDRVTLESMPIAKRGTENVGICTEINSNLTDSSSSMVSSKAMNEEVSFDFSTLDDGPMGKGSWIKLSPLERVFHEISSRSAEWPEYKVMQREIKKINDIITRNSDCQTIENAVANLILFIRQKEKECRIN